MKTVIFGANGQTGRLLTERALDAGHSAVAVTRHPDDFPIADPNLTVAGADVHDAAALVDIVAGCRRGALHARCAVHPRARRHLLGRHVPTSSRPSTRPTRCGFWSWSARPARITTRAAPVLRSHCGSSSRPSPARSARPCTTTCGGWRKIVRDSALHWTIVRPSGLFDLPYITEYVAGEGDPVGAFTSRGDLADYLVALAGRPR